MNTKHTPGPWTITKYDRYDKDIIISEPGVRVDFDDVDPDEQEANARLIAASPCLLEALTVLHDAVELIVGKDAPSLFPAKAAITKATGEDAP